MPQKSARLRELISAGGIFLQPWVGCALHAKLAESLGFKAVGISGSNVSGHILGIPDVGLITLTELAQNTQRICGAVDIPVMVDCDTGFGNAINVRRTVSAVIKAGAAGLFIEDQVAPKRCGFVKGKEILPLDEALGKYRAALDARDELDGDFVIMARTDARGAAGGSLEECIARLRAYKQAGVDMVYAEALQSMDELRTVRAAVEGPFFVTTKAIQPAPTLEQLREAGVCMAAPHPARAGNMAVWDLLQIAKTKGRSAAVAYAAMSKNHSLAGAGISTLFGRPKLRE
ncbi:MAG: isocitrate lyase/PEP mutase family protein [Deltaproteobacteria bacterium]|nr:isocitrate lyase/PEP mutase family protein [Deltaproteobacteria bacterium]